MATRPLHAGTVASRLDYPRGRQVLACLSLVGALLVASLPPARAELLQADHNGKGRRDGPDVTLVADFGGLPFASCGDFITVAIEMGPGEDIITAGQFFLEYDETRLDFVSLDVGDFPFTTLLVSVVDEENGLIDYAVGVPFGEEGTSDGATMGYIVFEAFAGGDSFVRFRSHWPPTLLTADPGYEVIPVLHDLNFYIYCGAMPPLPEDSLGISCTDDAQCHEEARCVLGVCYAPKQRYISIARNPSQANNTARRVRLDTGDLIGWIGEPRYVEPVQEPLGLWLADIVSAPRYEIQWPDVVHVIGCEIAHANLCDVSGVHCDPNHCPGGETCVHHSYHVQAIQIAQDIGDESSYSGPLVLHTPSTWGDTVSTCAGDVCLPPNGIVGVEDVMAAIKKYQSVDVAPIVWLDIDPSDGNQVPEQVIGVGDIMKCIDGFQSKPYPGDGPLNCP